MKKEKEKKKKKKKKKEKEMKKHAEDRRSEVFDKQQFFCGIFVVCACAMGVA